MRLSSLRVLPSAHWNNARGSVFVSVHVYTDSRVLLPQTQSMMMPRYANVSSLYEPGPQQLMPSSVQMMMPAQEPARGPDPNVVITSDGLAALLQPSFRPPFAPYTHPPPTPQPRYPCIKVACTCARGSATLRADQCETACLEYVRGSLVFVE